MLRKGYPPEWIGAKTKPGIPLRIPGWLDLISLVAD